MYLQIRLLPLTNPAASLSGGNVLHTCSNGFGLLMIMVVHSSDNKIPSFCKFNSGTDIKPIKNGCFCNLFKQTVWVKCWAQCLTAVVSPNMTHLQLNGAMVKIRFWRLIGLLSLFQFACNWESRITDIWDMSCFSRLIRPPDNRKQNKAKLTGRCAPTVCRGASSGN